MLCGISNGVRKSLATLPKDFGKVNVVPCNVSAYTMQQHRATSKNSTFRINKSAFFETFACFDFVDVAIARNS